MLAYPHRASETPARHCGLSTLTTRVPKGVTMKSYVWKWKAMKSRQRLSRLHRLVAATLYTSWTKLPQTRPDDSLMGWTSGLAGALSSVLDLQQSTGATQYVTLDVDRLARQLGIGQLEVLKITIDLQVALERQFSSIRSEPFFALWTTSNTERRPQLKVMAAMPPLMQ